MLEHAKNASPKRQLGSASKKGKRKLEVVGSSGLSPNSPASPLPNQPKDSLAEGRLQASNALFKSADNNDQLLSIPVQVAQDGQLVQVPESEMNAAQIKHMRDAADIPNLFKNQNLGNEVRVLMRDVDTGEQHLVMYTVNEKSESGGVSGGVIAGGKGGQTFDMVSPGTFTGGEPASVEEDDQRKANADVDLDDGEVEEPLDAEGESMGVVEEDGLSDSAMKPKDGNHATQENIYKVYNTKQPLSDSHSGRALDSSAYRPITSSHRQNSNRHVNESSRRSAGSLSAKRVQSGRNKKKLKKNNRVSSTHSL